MLSRLWRAIFQVALYLAGTNITEALLFLPTLLILFVPSFILDVSRAIAISLLASIYGESGEAAVIQSRDFCLAFRQPHARACGNGVLTSQEDNDVCTTSTHWTYVTGVFSGKKGQYTTADGQRYPYSLTAYYDDLDFRAPAPLKRHTTSFPSKKALSLTNAQVLMSAISVSQRGPDPVIVLPANT